jgi:hypothetical protein
MQDPQGHDEKDRPEAAPVSIKSTKIQSALRPRANPRHSDRFPDTKADRWLVDRLATKDSFAVNIDRSLPPNQRSPRPRVTISLSLLLELASRANDPNQFAVQ